MICSMSRFILLIVLVVGLFPLVVGSKILIAEESSGVEGPSGPSFFVSPSGNDAWSGRLAELNADGTDGPFATLRRARDAMRRNPNIDTVYICHGSYSLNGTQGNFGTASSHDITVQVTDSGGLTYAESFAITVGDVNEGAGW